MKNKCLLILIVIMLQSCFPTGEDDDGFVSEPPPNYEPVIMNRAEFEASASYESTPRAIENSGKIYVKGDYILVNEVNKGFHIINNSNPLNPNNIGFIKVLGSSDLSIKSNVFYANNATDLIAFKLNESNQSINITKRLQDVFPQIWSPEGFIYHNLQEDEIIVDWIPID
jgi:hypothetical protein